MSKRAIDIFIEACPNDAETELMKSMMEKIEDNPMRAVDSLMLAIQKIPAEQHSHSAMMTYGVMMGYGMSRMEKTDQCWREDPA